jgi:hydroxymethylbilane synthase
MLIRLGTRQSALALWQANYVASLLRSDGHEVELVKITTAGDVSTTPLGESGGQGVFTKEIQRALLENRCDLAVHSLKDLPTEVHSELTLAAVPPREDPADCLLSRGKSLAELPHGSTIGSGSPRRKASLLHLRPDLVINDIRGNVETRIRKLDNGEYDAIVLAYAGLKRLGLEARITQKFSTDEMLPAVGQAALGLETRSSDSAAINALRSLDHVATHAAVLAERTLLRSMRAGCLAPLACNATLHQGSMQLNARVFSSDGKIKIETQHAISHALDIDDSSILSAIYLLAEQLGRESANKLIAKGAAKLIDASLAE